MVAVTYSGARAATTSTVAPKARAKTGVKSKNFLARVYDAICESQMKRAERELALHRHLLPPDFKFEAGKRWSRRHDEPLGGW